jgi:hypothetical protein
MSRFGLKRKRVKKTVRKKSKRKSRFGNCGCSKQKSSFGKNKLIINKLHKLCKLYKVKIAKHTPEYLRKQCLKKAKMMLKKIKQRKSRFGSFLGFPNELEKNTVNADLEKNKLQLQAQIDERKIKTQLEIERQRALLAIQIENEKVKAQRTLQREEEEHQRKLREAKERDELQKAINRKKLGLDVCPPCKICDSEKHDTAQHTEQPNSSEPPAKFGKKRKKSTLKF